MKISISPLQILRERAVTQVNAQFKHAANSHTAEAYRRKREIAIAVMSGESPTKEFSAEALLRGLTNSKFAALILSKPNHIDASELSRQIALIAIAKATSIRDIENAIERTPI